MSPAPPCLAGPIVWWDAWGPGKEAFSWDSLRLREWVYGREQAVRSLQTRFLTKLLEGCSQRLSLPLQLARQAETTEWSECWHSSLRWLASSRGWAHIVSFLWGGKGIAFFFLVTLYPVVTSTAHTKHLAGLLVSSSSSSNLFFFPKPWSSSESV